MTIPSLFFAFLLASLYGVLYHLWRSGGPWRILFYLVLAWAGFFFGHFLATWQSWHFLRIGQLEIGIGTLVAFTMLLLGDWFTLDNSGER